MEKFDDISKQPRKEVRWRTLFERNQLIISNACLQQTTTPLISSAKDLNIFSFAIYIKVNTIMHMKRTNNWTLVLDFFVWLDVLDSLSSLSSSKSIPLWIYDKKKYIC